MEICTQSNVPLLTIIAYIVFVLKETSYLSLIVSESENRAWQAYEHIARSY